MNHNASERAMPPVPSELAGPPPRKVRLKLDQGDGRFLLMVVLVSLVGGGLFFGWNCYYDVNQFHQRSVLRSNGGEVIGEVTGFAYHRDAPLGIYYKFIVNGMTYSGEALKPNTPMSGSALAKGDNLPIRFLPSNPEINHPAAWEWSVAIGWYTTAGVAGAIAIGVLVLAALLRDRKLARYGKPVSGVVLDHTRDGRLFRVKYEFRTEDDIATRGDSVGPDEYGTGERIWVLYLPSKPNRNHRYPLDFFEVVE